MKWTGKLIGVVAGYLAGGPWGAVVGCAVGHFARDRHAGAASDPAPDELVLAGALVALVASVSAGEGSAARLWAIQQVLAARLGLGSAALRNVPDLARQFWREKMPLSELCEDLRSRFDGGSRASLAEAFADLSKPPYAVVGAAEAIRVTALLGAGPLRDERCLEGVRAPR